MMCCINHPWLVGNGASILGTGLYNLYIFFFAGSTWSRDLLKSASRFVAVYMFVLDYWYGYDGRMNTRALRLHRGRMELHPSLTFILECFFIASTHSYGGHVQLL